MSAEYRIEAEPDPMCEPDVTMVSGPLLLRVMSRGALYDRDACSVPDAGRQQAAGTVTMHQIGSKNRALQGCPSDMPGTLSCCLTFFLRWS